MDRILKNLSVVVFFSVAVLLAAGCGKIYQNYDYQGQEIENLPGTTLRIAVLPFQDKRTTFDKGSFKLAYLPLVPSSARRVQRKQTEADRSAADYYYPGLIAHSLQSDLKKNNVAEVHYAPQVLDHYDLVFDGDLNNLILSARNNTYGLSYAGRLLAMIGLPPAYISVSTNASYRASLASGEILFEEAYDGSWGWIGGSGSEEEFLEEVHAFGSPQNIHGTVTGFREMNEQFLNAVSESIRNLAEVVDDTFRAQGFYAALDPDMQVLTRRLEQNLTRRDQSLYQQRQQWLERYRQHEWRWLEKEEVAKQKLITKRLIALAQLRNQKRNVKIARKAAERARTKAFMGQFASVLAASGQAMATRRNAGISDSVARDAFLRDAARGMGGIRPSNIPSVPDDRLLAQLGRTDFRGLSAVDINSIANIRGATIAEMRAKFLRLYRRKFGRIR